jgi:16S rRNA (guanine527-N7)-methyltransferase
VKLDSSLEALGLSLEQSKISKLKDYSKNLLEWNSIHNLSGAKNLDDIYQNILDSIYPIKFIKEPKSLLDIGSGAGFPAIALGIVWDSCEITLCEPRNKRASFLRLVALELGLENVKVEKKRVEDLDSPPFSMITSRAVNSVEMLLKLSSDLSDENTSYLLFKGERVYQEIEGLSLDYEIFKRGSRNYLFIKRVRE